MPSVDLIRRRLSEHDPTLAERRDPLAFEAAVALILHETADTGPEILFIERALREGDPWSGQMAFPGGRRDREDRDLERTAARETREEVGVVLGAPLGQLDEFEGRRGGRPQPLIVAPYVYALEERPAVVPNHEVSSTVWVPLRWILHPDSAVQYSLEREEYGGTFPAIHYERYTIWGLTYRILSTFVEVLGRSLPDPGL